jgi:hypothetical protein
MYADPFDIEAQKKIEAAIRQVSFFSQDKYALLLALFLFYVTDSRGKMA